MDTLDFIDRMQLAASEAQHIQEKRKPVQPDPFGWLDGINRQPLVALPGASIG
jgi:hypothetical protein